MKRIKGTRWRVILGPPGTGKTTAATKGFAAEIKNRGTDADHLYFITFTRRAMNEAKDKLQDPLKGHGLLPSDVENVRTMHGQALKLLGGKHGSLIAGKHWKVFRQAGWRTMKHEQDRVLLDALNWGRAYGLDLVETERCCPHLFDRVRFRRFVAEYTAFKRANRLIDHTDSLELVLRLGLVPPRNVEKIFFDEAQDFSLLQAKVADLWASVAHHALAFGDDDQCIFTFQGSSAAWLAAKFKAHGGRVLSQSHRVPRLPRRLAELIISKNPNRVRKSYYPRDADGSIVRVAHLDDLISRLVGKDNLVLARDAYALVPVALRLKELGIPFADTTKDREANSYEEGLAIAAAKTAVSLTNGFLVSASDIVEMLSFVDYRRRSLVPNKVATVAALQAMQNAPIAAAGVVQILHGGTLLRELAAHGPLGALKFVDAEHKAVAAHLAKGGTAAKIVLSTIHSTKGGQAAVVAIVPDMSRRSFLELQRDPETERRLAYVAVTRTKDTLVLMSPRTPMHFADYFLPVPGVPAGPAKRQPAAAVALAPSPASP